jgi:hypothetical protein
MPMSSKMTVEIQPKYPSKKGIPAIFYFNGVHDDYHKSTDTPDKIDYPQINVFQLKYETIYIYYWY